MIDTFPGTSLAFDSAMSENAFSVFSPILAATGGLTLAQLSEMVGLEGSTIQNWIKRGWVANPVNRRYSEVQIARIIIINMLKSSMSLDNIASLMGYVNGSVEDRSDDIIPDGELYNYLCAIIHDADAESIYDLSALKRLIKRKIKTFKCASKEAEEKLFKTLTVMTLAYMASQLTKKADTLFAELDF